MTNNKTTRELLREFAPKLADYTDTVLFGELWQRKELSPRDRSLITVAALIASEHTAQLPYHLELALHNGVTQEELAEAMTHLAFYVGWPRAAAAVTVAGELWADYGDSTAN
ncbi:carboxymuconolactone decarboxylase family protein [Paenibacillus thailandensis]|uniref:Carboxymuconolactone decarboxylase family protein n=1 Tax=Paenibacillus thailandensis TaxID=393250 RepID=A0ABW5QYI4_9BACL